MNNLLDSIINFFNQIFTNNYPYSGKMILKIIFLVLMVIYLFYTILVVKQVYMMNKFLDTKLSPWTKVIAWLYFGLTLIVIVAICSL